MLGLRTSLCVRVCVCVRVFLCVRACLYVFGSFRFACVVLAALRLGVGKSQCVFFAGIRFLCVCVVYSLSTPVELMVYGPSAWVSSKCVCVCGFPYVIISDSWCVSVYV